MSDPTRPDPTPIHRHRQEALILGTLLILISVLALIYVIVWMAPGKSPTEVVRVPDDGFGPIRSRPEVSASEMLRGRAFRGGSLGVRE
jgi:hypothetical protein